MFLVIESTLYGERASEAFLDLRTKSAYRDHHASAYDMEYVYFDGRKIENTSNNIQCCTVSHVNRKIY